MSTSKDMVASEDKKETKDKDTVDLGSLEQDDEFEEFPVEGWDKNDEDVSDMQVWEANWDDDNLEDDFSQQLRIELQKNEDTEMKKE